MNKSKPFCSRHRRGLTSLLSIFLILILLANGCSYFTPAESTPLPTTSETSTITPGITPTPIIPQALVTFTVDVPVSGNKAISVFVDILDEVTGLALNPTRYRMDSIDSSHFTIQLPIRVGETIRYRYVRDGDIPAVEYTSAGQQVRYRLLVISTPTSVEDIVSAWMDTPYKGQTGRITGQVISSSNDTPVPDALICAGGVQGFTSSDGSFVLEGLPPGVHNLVAMTLDGAYQVFQQGAKIQGGSSTPAVIKLTPAKIVSITFNVAIPPEILGVPVRLAGDLYSLGDTFADLSGGMSTISSRMPVMSPMADGRQTLTLKLPAGADLHYKYTIGDGFWNAEHNSSGNFMVRDLIVPNEDTTMNDTVETWLAGQNPPITFNVSVPSDTPVNDYVSIQFNPYGWMEPIPMWSVGQNKWMFILFSPYNLIKNFAYRYCRNDQCGVADDVATQGPSAAGWQVKVQDISQTFNDVVSQWSGLKPQSDLQTNLTEPINPQQSSFVTGIEFQTSYQPSWQSRYLPLFQDLHSIGDQWVFLTPTWSYLTIQNPTLEPVAGKDPLWNDLEETILQARSSGIEIAVFPQPVFATTADQWWNSSTRDFSWWVAWFESYRAFLLNFADLSTQTKSSAMVIGGDWVLPALPGGKLQDGSSSGVPWDADQRWQDLIKEVKTHFTGPLIWATPWVKDSSSLPDFVKNFDEVYVLFSEPVASSSTPSVSDLETTFADVFDNNLAPWQQQLGKPIILGIAYPSALGGASNCITISSSGCVVPGTLNQTGRLPSSVQIDLQTQANLYEALMVVINSRNWIGGMVSRGFYPPAEVQDASTSVNGKPAYNVLKYWFSKLNN